MAYRENKDAVRIWRLSIDCVLEQETFTPSLVLIQPGKTRPDVTERLLTGT